MVMCCASEADVNDTPSMRKTMGCSRGGGAWGWRHGQDAGQQVRELYMGQFAAVCSVIVHPGAKCSGDLRSQETALSVRSAAFPAIFQGHNGNNYQRKISSNTAKIQF
ncbi:hypothetical protein E2C01_054206 [Portunus trituberculatus]|uniref:Uncharacterized protein n=1 Tax=Portunus trituberculatus TaxID=210409 RepID=A0A5B7GT42_PORTR|nr:hypothetical protein [Portunus trituberculatus]